MANINLNVDVSKIDKAKLVDREFTTKEGEVVKKKELQLVAIELKEPKFIKEGDTWTMKKTHFVVQKGDKDEEMPIIGDGIVFEGKEKSPQDPLDDFESPF